jgi:uncharacterized protein (DUF1697 family)
MLAGAAILVRQSLSMGMQVVVALLRGVNVGGNNLIRMEALRSLCESLKLRDACTYLQSGNVVFRTARKDLNVVARLIGNAIERDLGFCPAVMCRTAAEMRAVVARNPFAGRLELDPAKLAVVFLAADPGEEARQRFLSIEAGPEELRAEGRELYIYFPNGMGRSKLTPSAMDRALGMVGTARNWNSVTRLLEMAESLG